MKLRNETHNEVAELKATIVDLEDRIKTLENEKEFIYQRINELGKNHIKEIANVLMNKTFITRLSEDMFMAQVRDDFRKFKGNK